MIRVKKQQNFNLQMIWGILAGFGIVVYPALRPIPAIAQINQAIVQEIVKSEESAEENSVFIDEDLAEVNAIALLKQKIDTQAASASLLFSNGAMGRLGPQSSVIVGQCIEVQQGLLLASGPANGCTATFEIGVEGTVYAIEVNEEGETQVKVLEGELRVKPIIEESETTEEETSEETVTAETPQEIVVKAGEKITITPSGLFGQVAELLQSDVEGILTGALFQGFESPLLGTSALQTSLKTLYPNLEFPSLPGFTPSIPRPRPRLPF